MRVRSSNTKTVISALSELERPDCVRIQLELARHQQWHDECMIVYQNGKRSQHLLYSVKDLCLRMHCIDSVLMCVVSRDATTLALPIDGVQQ